MTSLHHMYKNLKTGAELVYWDLYFTVGYSCTAGLGNGLAAEKSGREFDDGFGEGFVHNFGPGLAVNAVYPLAFKMLEKTGNYRRNALFFTAVVNAGFLAWHYATGTEHPFAAMLPNLAIGLAMTNRHVNKTIDERVKR
jgi:hypothetical protein